MVSAVKAIKSFINCEIAGPAGPSKAYRGEDTPPPLPLRVQVRARPAARAFPSHPQCKPAVSITWDLQALWEFQQPGKTSASS